MSKDHNISSLFDRSGNLTPEAMERYLAGHLSAKEKALVDGHLADSPFDREALEGLKKLQKPGFQRDLKELDARIMAKARDMAILPRPRSMKPYYWAAAAGVVMLVGVTVLLVYMFRSPSFQELTVDSKQLTVVTEPEKGSNGPINPETAGTVETLEQPTVNGQRPALKAKPEGSEVSSQRSEVTSQQPDLKEVAKAEESPIEPATPIDVIENNIAADNMLEYDAEKMVVEDEIAVVEQDLVPEPPPVTLQEVQAVGGVSVSSQKRTGTSKKSIEDRNLVPGNARALPREDTTLEEKQVFVVVESMPEFPGGDEAFYHYLADSLCYPSTARENSIQGRVFVTFIVEKDGSISEARILRGIGGGCDEEALRVIQNMPKWIPGKQRGKPVRVQYNMPIKFTLDKK